MQEQGAGGGQKEVKERLVAAAKAVGKAAQAGGGAARVQLYAKAYGVPRSRRQRYVQMSDPARWWSTVCVSCVFQLNFVRVHCPHYNGPFLSFPNHNNT